jgi:LemA protein
MNKKRYSGYIIGGIIALLGIFLIVSYNGLVKKEEKVKNQWAEVQNAYQRRMDLIPNLVNVVKGNADYERTTLQKVVEARAKAGSITVSNANVTADSYNQQAKAQDELAASANQLIATIEKYPELRGTEAFVGLQVQLEGTERRIKIARKDFNEAIQNYNTSVRGFPTSLVGSLFGFKAKDGFSSDAGADKATEIKF